MEDSKRKELAAKWRKAKQEAWEKFIEENFGATKNGTFTPGCYGSGDGFIWCNECKYEPTC